MVSITPKKTQQGKTWLALPLGVFGFFLFMFLFFSIHSLPDHNEHLSPSQLQHNATYGSLRKREVLKKSKSILESEIHDNHSLSHSVLKDEKTAEERVSNMPKETENILKYERPQVNPEQAGNHLRPVVPAAPIITTVRSDDVFSNELDHELFLSQSNFQYSGIEHAVYVDTESSHREIFPYLRRLYMLAASEGMKHSGDWDDYLYDKMQKENKSDSHRDREDNKNIDEEEIYLETEKKQPIDGVELYHLAVRKGLICNDRIIPYDSFDSFGSKDKRDNSGISTEYIPTKEESDLFSTLVDMISSTAPKAFIEVLPNSEYLHLKAFSPLLAKVFPSLANIMEPVGVMVTHDVASRQSDDGDDDRSNDKSKEGFIENEKYDKNICTQQSLPSNLFIIQHNPKEGYFNLENESNVSNMHNTNREENGNLDNLLGMYSCSQFISNFEMLVNGQLPFEYEESLGNMLCRCDTTLLPRFLPHGAHLKDDYFQFWENVESLIRASVTALGLCTLHIDGPPSSIRSGYGKRVRYTHLVVRRMNNEKQAEVVVKDIENPSSDMSGTLTSKTSMIESIKMSSPSGHIPLPDLFLGLSTSKMGNNHLVHSVHNLAVSLLEYQDINKGLSTTLGENIKKSSEKQDSKNIFHDKSFIVIGSSVRHIDEEINTPSPSVGYHDDALISNTLKEEIKKAESDARNRRASLLLMNSHGIHHNTNSRRKLYATSKISSFNSTKTHLDISLDVPPKAVIGEEQYESVLSTKWQLPDLWNNITLDARPTLDQWDQIMTPFENHDLDEFSSLFSKPNEIDEKEGPTGDAHSAWHGGGISRGSSSKKTAFYSSSKTKMEKNLDTSDMNANYRIQQNLLQEREELVYRKWLSAMSLDLKNNKKEGDIDKHLDRSIAQQLKESSLVYIFGRHSSILSLKIAKSMRRKKTRGRKPKNMGLVVSVLADSLAVDPHKKLKKLLKVRNNLVCHSSLELSQLGALLAAPERADSSIFQLDVFTRIVALAASSKNHISNSCRDNTDALEESIGALLSLSKVSYIEMPSGINIKSVFSLIFSVKCTDELNKRYEDTSNHSSRDDDGAVGANILKFSLQRFNKASAIIREMKWYEGDKFGKLSSSHLYRVFVQYNDASDDKGLSGFSRRLGESVSGISLYTLSHFGTDPSLRRQLLQLYVDLPFWIFKLTSSNRKKGDSGNSITPWSLFVSLDDKPLSRLSHHQHHDLLTLNYHHSPYNYEIPTQIRNKDIDVTVSMGSSQGGDLNSERIYSRFLFSLIVNQNLDSKMYELAGGKFSFVEHGSGYGYFSSYLAKQFPNATIISLERDPAKVSHHVEMAERLNLQNNAVCLKTQEDDSILQNIVECPELFRFQLIGGGLVDAFTVASLNEWGQNIGTLLSSALTSYLYVPSGSQVSLAMKAIFPWDSLHISTRSSLNSGRAHTNIPKHTLLGPYRPMTQIFSDLVDYNNVFSTEAESFLVGQMAIENHPSQSTYFSNTGRPIINVEKDSKSVKLARTSRYSNFESAWLFGHSRAHSGRTNIQMRPLYFRNERVPFVRCDVLNMTRHVHHHYDFKRDGHSRTYTMQVHVNDTQTSQVRKIVELPTQDKAVETNNIDPFFGKESRQGKNHILLYNPNKREDSYITRNQTSSEKNETDNDNNNNNDNDYFDEANVMVGPPSFQSKFHSTGKTILLPAGSHPNEGQVTSIHLHRDKDSWPIPYTSIYGVTLISTLRLGLHPKQRDRLFKTFLHLPLYEDMAPWNVVLTGDKLDYIDYDTREVVFDLDVPKAYKVMTVLMNYKRTVEDFKRCGSKASTVYGLPYVSDCVGQNVKFHNKNVADLGRFGWDNFEKGNSLKAHNTAESKPKCDDLSFPVPCDDGICHSDYISCLRGLAFSFEKEAEEGIKRDINIADVDKDIPMNKNNNRGHRSWTQAIGQAMRSRAGSFDEQGMEEK